MTTVVKQEFVLSDNVSFKYFTAPWCQPCKTFGPIVEEVVKENNLNLEKIDAEKTPWAVPPDIMGVPTIIKYEDGKEVSRLVGARDKEAFQKWVTLSFVS